LARQAPTFLLQVDCSFQRDVQFAAVAEDRVRSDRFRPAVERKFLELREAPDRFALRLEHLPIIPPARRDAGTETCLRWHFVLRTDAADFLHVLLDAEGDAVAARRGLTASTYQSARSPHTNS